MAGHFYGGTSGLQISMPKRDFPSELQHKSRLGFYALHENSIEINSTFYKLPQAKTITAWSLQVPGHFRFTFKLWKEITPQKNLLFKTDAIRQFMGLSSGMISEICCVMAPFSE